MGFIRNRLARRFPFLGLASDVALVGAAAGRLLQRRNGTAATPASPIEMALAGGAAFRLFRRYRRRRKAKRILVIED